MRMKRLGIIYRKNHIPAVLLSCLILLSFGSCFASAAQGKEDGFGTGDLQTESEDSARSAEISKNRNRSLSSVRKKAQRTFWLNLMSIVATCALTASLFGLSSVSLIPLMTPFMFIQHIAS